MLLTSHCRHYNPFLPGLILAFFTVYGYPEATTGASTSPCQVLTSNDGTIVCIATITQTVYGTASVRQSDSVQSSGTPLASSLSTPSVGTLTATSPTTFAPAATRSSQLTSIASVTLSVSDSQPSSTTLPPASTPSSQPTSTANATSSIPDNQPLNTPSNIQTAPTPVSQGANNPGGTPSSQSATHSDGAPSHSSIIIGAVIATAVSAVSTTAAITVYIMRRRRHVLKRSIAVVAGPWC